MDEAALQDLFRQISLRGLNRHASQEELCEMLIQDHCLVSAKVIEAFQAVDRKHFLVEECEDGAYIDSPVRHGKLHQSAPSVYGRALEALELRPGLSFLNIGSGTGYFSALVARLIGKNTLHIGVERYEELVRHAQKKCTELGLTEIQFQCGNCYSIDIASSVKFDRIYVGAGAPREARFLFKLLKYDGIIVGPFDDEEAGGPQSLSKARCRGGRKYQVSQLLQVQFTGLVKPPEHYEVAEGEETSDQKRVVLRGPMWGASKRELFPPSFERTVMFLYWMNQIEGSLPNKLPWDIWTRYIVSMLEFDAFDPLPKEKICAACDAKQPSTQCGRCKKVHYCGRDCQRKHWPLHKGMCTLLVANDKKNA